MDLLSLHTWNVSAGEAVQIQRSLAAGIREEPIDLERARLIAGVDVSSSKGNPILTAGIVVWDRTTGQVVDSVSAQSPQTFPYVPGLLSFREIPIISQVLHSLTAVPDVFLVDGQGKAHPRRLGIASHLGLLLDRPTVGVGKSILCGEADEPAEAPGSVTSLMHNGEEIGRLLRTKEGSNPLVISVGHRITLDAAMSLVQACLRGYRLPEPTRLAHEYVNEMRKKMVDTAEATLLM